MTATIGQLPQKHKLRVVIGAPLQFLETFRRDKRRRLGFLDHQQRAPESSQPPSRNEASAFSASFMR